jgi:hypothetical protein
MPEKARMEQAIRPDGTLSKTRSFFCRERVQGRGEMDFQAVEKDAVKLPTHRAGHLINSGNNPIA